MRRWMPSLPRYRTPIILQEAISGPETKGGYNRQGTMYARILRAFARFPESGRTLDASAYSDVNIPTDPPPTSNLTPPTARYDEWVPWWGTPPSTNQSTYKIPDPPKIPRPISPTSALPVLYETRAVVNSEGGEAWHSNLEVSAVYLRAEWSPKVGKEIEQEDVLLDLSYVSCKVRPKAIRSLGIEAKRWELIHVDTGTIWDIEYIRESYRRSEFLELLVKEKR